MTLDIKNKIKKLSFLQLKAKKQDGNFYQMNLLKSNSPKLITFNPKLMILKIKYLSSMMSS